MKKTHTHNKQEGKNTNTQKGMQTNVCIKVLQNIFLVFTTCKTKNLYKLLLKPLRQFQPVCVCVCVCVCMCVCLWEDICTRDSSLIEGWGLGSLRRIQLTSQFKNAPKTMQHFLFAPRKQFAWNARHPNVNCDVNCDANCKKYTHKHSHGLSSPSSCSVSLRCGQVFCYLRPTTTS